MQSFPNPTRCLAHVVICVWTLFWKKADTENTRIVFHIRRQTIYRGMCWDEARLCLTIVLFSQLARVHLLCNSAVATQQTNRMMKTSGHDFQTLTTDTWCEIINVWVKEEWKNSGGWLFNVSPLLHLSCPALNKPLNALTQFFQSFGLTTLK